MGMEAYPTGEVFASVEDAAPATAIAAPEPTPAA